MKKITIKIISSQPEQVFQKNKRIVVHLDHVEIEGFAVVLLFNPAPHFPLLRGREGVHEHRLLVVADVVGADKGLAEMLSRHRFVRIDIKCAEIEKLLEPNRKIDVVRMLAYQVCGD
jgi:hypothetical protein